MSDVPHVLWNFLPGQHEVDAFAYLDEVRLTLRDMRLAGVRPITPVPAASVVLPQWDSAVTTYAIPWTAATDAVLRQCAIGWVRGAGERSLRLKTRHAALDTRAPADIDRFFTDALATVAPNERA